jgi:hypothetical protein
VRSGKAGCIEFKMVERTNVSIVWIQKQRNLASKISCFARMSTFDRKVR